MNSTLNLSRTVAYWNFDVNDLELFLIDWLGLVGLQATIDLGLCHFKLTETRSPLGVVVRVSDF